MTMTTSNNSTAVPAIELTGVSKRFRTPKGGVFTALRDFDLTIAPGEFCAVVGPTGCGKSTTLTLVSGLETASAGNGRGRRQAGLRHHSRRGIHVPAGCGLPLEERAGQRGRRPQVPRPVGRKANTGARDWLRRVGLAGFEDRYPHQLSGGMRKRVALAQSLINEPRVLLMDEPFSALDVQTRSIMSDELLGLWDLTRPAVIFVTHDLEEAIALADKVVVLTAGPGTVKAVFQVDLPRPRKVQEIRFDPEFIAIYENIWEALRSEVPDRVRPDHTAAAA